MFSLAAQPSKELNRIVAKLRVADVQKEVDTMGTQVFEERTLGTQSGASESSRTNSEDKSQLSEMAESVVNSAKQTASSVASQAREQVTSRAEQQRQTAASGVFAVAGAVRKATEELRQQDGSGVTQYAAECGETLAERIEGFSSYLRGHTVSQMVGELEDFARARPAYFLGCAFLAGLAASRFFKSTRRRPDATTTAMDRP